MKTCSKCRVPKTPDEFHKHSGRKDGLSNECKPCSSIRSKKWTQKNLERRAKTSQIWYATNKDRLTKISRKWREANPDKTAVYNQKHSLLKYGLSPEEFELIKKSQNFRCGVCELLFSKANFPCVDHDHATGKVRGLLCRKCNFMLGLADDSPSRLIAAAAYIQKDLLTKVLA